MNEQQLADLFSNQVDRLLQGESTNIPSDAEDLQELLDIVGQPTAQTQFQASASTWAAFQSQLANWFGPLANGGSLMTILGLSKAWFISIVITTVVVITAAGIIAVTATSILIASSSSEPATVQPTDQPTDVPTDQPTDVPTDQPTGEPTDQPADEPLSLVFVNNILINTLCQGTYSTQSTIVNSGDSPINDAMLVSDVIEGADLVDNVDIISPSLSDSLFFNSISTNQKVDLDIKVKVKDNWWKKPNGTKIKVKLSVKHKGGSKGGGTSPSQIITIVNQSAQYVVLSGVAHDNGDGTLLIDGNIVTMDDCTGLPPIVVIGSNVQVIGLLQPDGSFLAINISIINITVVGDFDSGVPVPGPDSGDGGDSGGGGGGKGGSKKGGSKGN